MSAPTVFVVDDDPAVLDALGMLFRAEGLRVEGYASARDFLARAVLQRPCCLVLDVRMPGMTGTALQEALAERGVSVPIVFLTGHGDVPMAVAAMRKGAWDFLQKPFDDARLLGRVRAALEKPALDRPGVPLELARLQQLSRREQEVLDGVLAGKSSRQIGDELRISLKTVEFHRSRLMRKLGVRTSSELLRMCFAA